MSSVDVVILCPPGFEDIVAEAVRRELPRVSESVRTSGFVRVRTAASVKQLRAFPCATNVFAVIADVPRTAIDREVNSLRERLPTTPRSSLPRRGTLRLRIHDDGQFASTISPETVALENALGSWSQLGVSRRGASLEVWLIRRSRMRSSLLATRLSGGRPHLARGRLRPEICAALARVEPLTAAELVLDPFAGSGAIGAACLEAGAKSVWLNDLDAKVARWAERQGMRWTNADFHKLRVATESIDAIVTDPPWGRYWRVKHGVENLYRDLGGVAKSWLRPGGALVLLTGAPDTAVELMLDAGKLRRELVLPVLVNGSKAKVLRARKGRRRRSG